MESLVYQIHSGNIVLTGDLTFDTVKDIYEYSLLHFPKSKIVKIDCSALANVDSAGLSLFIYWFTKASKHNQELKLENTPLSLSQLARVSGVDSFGIFNLSCN